MAKYTFKKATAVEIKNEMKGVLTSAEVCKKTDGTDIAGSDKNGNPYVKLQFNFLMEDGSDEGRTMKHFVMFPYDLDGESIGDQILELVGLDWKGMKDGQDLTLDTDIFKNKDCTLHVGAVRAEEEDYYGNYDAGDLKVYRNDKGEIKLSREIIKVLPAKSFGKSWTDRDQQNQDDFYKEYKAMLNGEEPATAEDAAFDKEFPAKDDPKKSDF